LLAPIRLFALGGAGKLASFRHFGASGLGGLFGFDALGDEADEVAADKGENGLQRFQKCDQGRAILLAELEAELVAGDRSGTAVIALRHVVGVESLGIQPFLQGVSLSGVSECSPKPDSAQEDARFLVETRDGSSP